MWNAGSEPGRIVEVITPGGFENYFRELGELLVEDANDPLGEVLPDSELPDKYGLTYGYPDWMDDIAAPVRAEPALALSTADPRFGELRTRSVTLHLPTRGGAAR